MPVTTFEKSTRIRELAKINGIIIAQVFQIWDAALDTGMEWSCPECGEVKCIGYQEIVDIGIPICSDCDSDSEMELV